MHESALNRQEPELLREVFPYTQPPRIPFDGVRVAPHPAKDPHITDTTFRDGQQARAPYTPQEILRLFDLLHRLGGEAGLVRQSEFFLYSERDRRAVEVCQERGYRFPEVTAWIRARPEDFALVKAAGVRETGILTSCSDYHIYRKLRLDRRRAVEAYLAIVDAALAEGIVPRCHFEDVTRADIEGFVVPFARILMERSRESGIQVKIRLCDTLGYGVGYDDAAPPRSVPKLVAALRHEAGVPEAALEWHGHNDFHHGLSNAVTAWHYGCGAVNGTLLGFGERTGNTPIEGLLFEWMGLTGRSDVDTLAVSEVARYAEESLSYRIPPMTPFVGSQSQVTAAGIHLDGLRKDEEIYSIFDTGRLLGRPPGVLVTDKAGIAGVALWLERKLGLAAGSVAKDHPAVECLHGWVEAQYRDGRVTAISDAELSERLARARADGLI
ncbi:MAG: 2-isopropylmalate synthase [Thermaerobacter sp.]|nr:2-isopropylmalate synthase [Thermaerobacter sp.]